jgi:hypothetical protein
MGGISLVESVARGDWLDGAAADLDDRICMPGSCSHTRERRDLMHWTLARTVVAALCATLGAASCDNPACVFGPGNCTGNHGGTPGVGANPATIPADGAYIASNPPHVDTLFPTGTNVGKNSPIVLVFNESVSSAGLASAFAIQVASGTQTPLANVVLAADDRVLIALPLSPLTASTQYTVVFRQGASIVDLVGRKLMVPSNGTVGTFTTAATDPATPKVVMSWPATTSTNQSSTPDSVVVFDRAMDSTTVTQASFVVTVNGAPPPFNPPPTPLTPPGGGPDTRAFRYKSIDSHGVAQSFGPSASCAFALSPPGALIKDTAGQALGNTTISFTTAPFTAPSGASITSMPTTAIGIHSISGPADLAVAVDLVGATSGDFLDLYMFGKEHSMSNNPPLAALFREVALAPPFTSFTMTAAEIDLLQTASPFMARFSDGPIAFAFLVRRGTTLSPVKLLDVDPMTPGVQNPTLDTVPPTLLGLGETGTALGTFASDVRDLAMVGRANESLGGAVVSTPLGDNMTTPGNVPAVTGQDASGLFTAAPVHVGLVDPASLPLSYTITIYDKALNPATAAIGTFNQLGASGPGAALPGGNVTVGVFDATSLAPIPGASVFTHANAAGTVTAVASGTTDATGSITLAAASASGAETIVTVVKPGFDLFTFDGVPTARLSVPLTPSLLSFASASGEVTTTSSTVELATKSCADSRSSELMNSLFPVGNCSMDPTGQFFTCTYGPIPISPVRIGAEAAVAVVVPTNPFQYSPSTFLKAYQPSLPVPGAFPGGVSGSVIQFTSALDDPNLDPSELPVDVAPAPMLSTANYPLFTTGTPLVRLEAKTPGIRGALTTGQGVAYDDPSLMLPPNTWLVHAAYAGAVETIDAPPAHNVGRLVMQGTVEVPLMLRCEITDSAGNTGGVRAALPIAAATLVPPASAVLASPAVTLNPGGLSLDLAFSDVLPDAVGEPGLYRVTLTDVTGLHWTIFRTDGPDSAGPNAIAHLPFVSPGATFPLAPGSVNCQVSAFAWPTFDPAHFLWTDVAREHDVYSHATTASFTPP